MAHGPSGRITDPSLRRAASAVHGRSMTTETHLSIALAVQAARRVHRVAFATAHSRVNRLGAAKRAGQLDEELERLGCIPLLFIDEVGYIPFDPEAASLFFAVVSSRYERRSLILREARRSAPGPEIFSDPVAVAAMVDRLVHHAEVIVLKGESYRLRGKREEVMSGSKQRWTCSGFDRRYLLRFGPALTGRNPNRASLVY